jgi:hypothetical protein
MLRNLRNRSKEDVSYITEEYIEILLKKQEYKCALSGQSFLDGNKPSIDRIDSTKGYIEDNIQLVTIDINYMKQEYPQDYFILLCKAVARSN